MERASVIRLYSTCLASLFLRLTPLEEAVMAARINLLIIPESFLVEAFLE
jgi:hypothetical protein